jgi:hypothetical protein
MSGPDATLGAELAARPHCAVGLIVTGEGERDFLPNLFTGLMQRAGCSFRVKRRVGQKSPITSEARKLSMVGAGRTIPTADEEQIGLEARRFLRNQPAHFLILIDDVERTRRPVIDRVFRRYRSALDTMLSESERERASVHFFANMLEAYYFAHSQAVNQALMISVLNQDWPYDVESIGHPKAQLKGLFQGFDERAHGALIVPLLDLDHILSNPRTCAFLRSLFGWCVSRLCAHAQCWDPDLRQRYQLQDGLREPLTNGQ